MKTSRESSPARRSASATSARFRRLGLLRVVVDAVVDAEHVADGSDRPRPSRVVEPGHARMRQASCRAPDHPRADAAVDGAADPIPLSPWQHVERLAHGDPRRRPARPRPGVAAATAGRVAGSAAADALRRSRPVSTKRTGCPRSAARRMICWRFVGRVTAHSCGDRQTIENAAAGLSSGIST